MTIKCVDIDAYANKVLMDCEKMRILIEDVFDDVFSQTEMIQKYPLLVNDCFERGEKITDMILDYVLSVKNTNQKILDIIRQSSKNEQEE